MKRIKIKSTLSGKLVLLFSAILVTVTALNLLISKFLIKRVYYTSKIDDMVQAYDTLKAGYNEGEGGDEVAETVKKLISNNNMRIFAWDSEDNLIVDSVPLLEIEDSSKKFSEKPKEKPQDDGVDRKKEWNRPDPHNGEFFIFKAEVDKKDLVKVTDDYSIIAFSNFADAGQQSLYLRGKLPDNYKVLIQLPIAPITEALQISGSTSLMTGVIMLMIGVVVVFFAAKRIARPVSELSEIAKSMQRLDFSKRYHGKRSDEIGDLGNSINAVSEKLQSTIEELREKNEILKKDNEQKEHIDEMRREFIANASHELKTPVALISGYAEGLRDGIAEDKEARKVYTDVIIEEASRMNDIIRQMLDLMELEEKGEVIDAEEFSLGELTHAAADSLAVLVKKENIDMTLESDDDTTICGDRKKIYRAVLNYMTNAVHHVSGDRKIKVTVESRDDEVYLGVYNTGSRIPEEDMDKIWEKFYKVDKAHTRDYGGTGLGLPIVSSIVRLHGGTCGVENKEDGVEFYMILGKEIKKDAKKN